MTENLQKAYDAYQQALVNLRDPKVRPFSDATLPCRGRANSIQDPMLWYGIGILYDRYGSYDYAEEAFSQVMQIQPDFEKANEIYFRLGIIYKQQSKFGQSLEVCRLHTSQSHLAPTHMVPVLQIYCQLPPGTPNTGGHLVPNWSCSRATKRRKLNSAY